ncbi:MAG TPA: hypothetical protein VGH81_03610 [Rudaea sp.]|jgi:hypothetical protein
MKRTSFAFSALLLAGGSFGAAHAAESSLTINCSNPHLPRMADVSAVTGIDNFGAAFAMREKLFHQATRLCHNPEVSLVRFVPDTIVTVEPLKTVAAR